MRPIFKALSIIERKQKTPLALLDFPEPSPNANEILIEVVAAAQNPIDWKQLDYDIGIPYLPWTNGGDVAGVVYKVGSKVSEFRPGDRVISYLTRVTPRHGGYQTFCLAVENRTVKLPDFVSFESGSTFPMAFVTAAAGSMDALGVSLPSANGSFPAKQTGTPFLVWGGSGSVGSYTIQVAKLSGYIVITTASPKNFGYVKSLGADYVFDYHDANVVTQIREAAGINLSLAYDTIAEKGSTEAAVKCITSPAGGTVATIQSLEGRGLSTRNIKVVVTGAQAADKPRVGNAVYGLLDMALQRNALKPNRVKVMPNGLLGVNEGFELGRQHKISGEKLVYRVRETKF